MSQNGRCRVLTGIAKCLRCVYAGGLYCGRTMDLKIRRGNPRKIEVKCRISDIFQPGLTPTTQGAISSYNLKCCGKCAGSSATNSLRDHSLNIWISLSVPIRLSKYLLTLSPNTELYDIIVIIRRHRHPKVSPICKPPHTNLIMSNKTDANGNQGQSFSIQPHPAVSHHVFQPLSQT